MDFHMVSQSDIDHDSLSLHSRSTRILQSEEVDQKRSKRGVSGHATSAQADSLNLRKT